MTDTDWDSAIAALVSLGVSGEEAGNAMVGAFGNAEYTMLRQRLYRESCYGMMNCEMLAMHLIRFPDEFTDRAIELSNFGYGAYKVLEQLKAELSLAYMLDGTPIVDAEPMVFQRNGIWYRADGTPIED